MIEFLTDYSGAAMGLLIAAAGAIVWFFPQAMAGYYNVPREKRDEVDWRGLRRYLAIGFGALGAAVAVLGLVIRNEGISYAVRIAVAFVGVIALVGSAQRFDRSK